MRWFKHMVATWDDEKIAAFVDSCGLEGYGFWWRVLELVAAQVDASGKNYCSYPKRKWCNMLAINHQTWSKLIARAEQAGLFVVSDDEQGVRVMSPNILKFRDEWTERKSKTRELNTRNSLPRARATDPDTETDTEEDKNKNINTASAAPDAEPIPPASLVEEASPNTAPAPAPVASSVEHAGQDIQDAHPPAPPKGKRKSPAPPPDEPHYRTKSGRYLTGKRLAAFGRFWECFALARGKAEAADAWLDIPQLTTALVESICHAARCEAAERPALEAKGKTPKWAQGWLNARRWEDYPSPTKARDSPDAAPPAYTKAELTPEQRAKADAVRNALFQKRREALA